MLQDFMEEIRRQPSRRRSRIREAHEIRILSAAEDVFARFGYNGAAIEAIGERAGMSKQSMLYYFPSKEVMYLRVLANILSLWLDKLVLLDQDGADPAAMLENYIRGKIELSRTHPNGSKVFANEIINGAPYIKKHLQSVLTPIDPYHLFFVIWSATQTYADFSTQIQLSLKKEELDDDDFNRASDFLTQMVLKGIGLK